MTLVLGGLERAKVGSTDFWLQAINMNNVQCRILNCTVSKSNRLISIQMPRKAISDYEGVQMA